MFDLEALETSLDERGYFRAGRVLDDAACRTLIDAYADDARFRSRVVMERHNFGRGEYKYFADPLPPVVQTLRETAYDPLAAVANRWMELMHANLRYPPALDAFLARCAQAGQTRPTPLILRYDAGGYNCLHQDLYGELAFPLQMVIMLSDCEREYDGGELVLVEQRPRMQSKPSVIRATRGEAIVFCTNERPVRGRSGYYRVKMRHGVSEITRGERYALGIIFHNAA
jgi:uncharacterized protein